jgi:hypothetical protein
MRFFVSLLKSKREHETLLRSRYDLDVQISTYTLVRPCLCHDHMLKLDIETKTNAQET